MALYETLLFQLKNQRKYIPIKCSSYEITGLTIELCNLGYTTWQPSFNLLSSKDQNKNLSTEELYKEINTLTIKGNPNCNTLEAFEKGTIEIDDFEKQLIATVEGKEFYMWEIKTFFKEYTLKKEIDIIAQFISKYDTNYSVILTYCKQCIKSKVDPKIILAIKNPIILPELIKVLLLIKDKSSEEVGQLMKSLP